MYQDQVDRWVAAHSFSTTRRPFSATTIFRRAAASPEVTAARSSSCRPKPYVEDMVLAQQPLTLVTEARFWPTRIFSLVLVSVFFDLWWTDDGVLRRHLSRCADMRFSDVLDLRNSCILE